MKTILKNQENKIAKLETEIVEVKSNLVELGNGEMKDTLAQA